MDGAAVEQIAGLARKPMELGGFLYSPSDWAVSDPAALIKPGPSAKTLGVATLGAIRDYLAANKDDLNLGTLVVHVASPSIVALLGPLDARARVREVFVQATCTDLTDGFLGRYMALEDFLVGVQVRFVDVDARKQMLGLLASVKHEQVKSATDDGMTQTVQARAGVVLVSDVSLPNPVLLTPYRTFRDVVQPNSLFVLRAKSGHAGGLPEVGLFEADGGAWKLSAIERIRRWFTDAVPAISVLA